jgi:trimeric autotransporter adhesin
VKRDSAGGFSAGGISATAITATASSNTGLIQATNSNAWAIYGQSANNSGVIGVATTYGWAGVLGSNTNAGGIGVEGFGVTEGVHAEADLGVRSIGGTYGVYSTSDNTGVYGNGANYGVWGETSGSDGVHGISHAAGGSGVGAVNDAGGDGIFAAATNGGFAGFFLGDVDVDGNLSKAGGSFKIDHPLDPSEKYLYHSFVESPDMKNIYDGNVTTDAQGNAVVTMPEWFEALNRDFRYQLTVIGQFAEAVVASKISNHRFAIRTDKPNVEVSWQVTGIRQDAWANAHRIPVEQLKPEKERGFYLHPELFGAPAEKSTAWARHPDSMKRQNNSQPKAPLVRARPLAASR